MQRVLLIGWDGATFDLIRPWVAQGKLPTIKRIMDEGAHSPLRSTVPPWTFPAWTSFMTGKNPGKHGIFDFFRLRPGTYNLEFVNGAHRRGSTFWRLLSDAGRDVIAISIPCTFPPEKVKGVMISGFDAPGVGGGGAAVDVRGMYPPELHDELLHEVGAHPIDSLIYEINAGRLELGVQRSLETIRQKAATTKYLMTHKPWDCCMILFGESDGIGHHYWKYCDPNSPLYQENPALADSILRVYQELDRQAGELLALAPAGTAVLMMSDHGFGGVTNWVVYPNCWLRERGFLRFRGKTTQWLARALEALKLSAISYLPVKLKGAIYRMGGAKLGGLEARVRFSMIDWSGTEAFFDENPYYPAVWINLKGRQPEGIVEPGRHYEEVRDRLIGDLESWRHPQTGEPMVEKAYRREDVYSGPHVAGAPDVVVKWGLCQGYSYPFRLSSKSRSRSWIERVDPNAPQFLESFTGKSGSHRDYGIFLACGACIRSPATPDNPRIIDLAPTVLRLLDVPVPGDMDGRVLEEILTGAYAAVPAGASAAAPTQVLVGAADSQGSSANGDGNYSVEDEETISKRLKSLGYVE